jgi:hypothetical protein
MELPFNEIDGGKPKISEKTCPNVTLYTRNATWTEQVANPGFRGEKLETDGLSYGTTRVPT